MSLIKKKKSSAADKLHSALDKRVEDLLLRLKPRTQLDDLEDWIDQYGAGAIVHDIMLIATGKSVDDQNWLEVAVALAECFMKIERINHEARTGKRTSRTNR